MVERAQYTQYIQRVIIIYICKFILLLKSQSLSLTYMQQTFLKFWDTVRDDILKY